MIWATLLLIPSVRGELSGPHSRDYDTLLGRRMLLIEMYLWGLPGVAPMHCEYETHTARAFTTSIRWENPDGTNNVESGEPMTVSRSLCSTCCIIVAIDRRNIC